jgi:hypothetical protein
MRFKVLARSFVSLNVDSSRGRAQIPLMYSSSSPALCPTRPYISSNLSVPGLRAMLQEVPMECPSMSVRKNGSW